MKAQDLKKQLLNVVGPVDFSQTPLELLQNLPMPKPMRLSADIFHAARRSKKQLPRHRQPEGTA